MKLENQHPLGLCSGWRQLLIEFGLGLGLGLGHGSPFRMFTRNRAVIACY